MEDARTTQGLSSAEAQRRLARLGEPEPPNSRSVASIVRANVLTLFNAIIGVLLHPHAVARAVRRRALRPDRGRQLGDRDPPGAEGQGDPRPTRAAGRAAGEGDPRRPRRRADGRRGRPRRHRPGRARRPAGRRRPRRRHARARRSTSRCSPASRTGSASAPATGCSRARSGSRARATTRSTRSARTATRRRSPARRASSATPPSPLQVEVNTVLKATTIALVPIALIVLSASRLHDKAFRDAAQEATAGLVTLIPEGLVLLMSVTLAVAAVRLARQNTLVQQMAATEALAAVDTICVDKTGTLTDGTLKLVGVEPADPNRAGRRRAGPRHLRRLGRRAQPDPGDDRRALPGPPRAAERRGAVLVAVEMERDDLERLQLRDRGPGRARPAPERCGCPRDCSGRSPSTPAPGAAWSPSARRAAACPPTRPPAAADGSSRGRWSCSRRRCAPTPPRRSPTCATSRST